MKIVLVGPKDSVNIMEEVGGEFGQAVELMTLTFDRDVEVLEKIERIEGDVFIFSGPFPYELVKKNLDINKAMVYVPYSGSSLYRCLWSIKEDGYDMENISFDTVSVDIVHEIYDELGLPFNNLNVLEYGEYKDEDELVRYHEEMYLSGRSKVVVTCLRSAYDILKQKNIPVYRVTPVKNMIRETFNLAIEKGKTDKVLSTQICAQLIKTLNSSKLSQSLGSEYEVQILQVQLYEKLIAYCREVQGSVFNLNNYEYLVFTTRGAIENVTDNFKNSYILQSISLDKLELAIGTGIGRTANEAVNNARFAVEESTEKGGSCEYITVGNEVVGPLGGTIKIGYKRNVGLEDMARSNDLTMGVTTLGKIKSLIDIRQNREVTSQDLAQYLGISERSARRLITDLINNDLAEECGEQRLHTRGRNRKVYRVKV